MRPEDELEARIAASVERQSKGVAVPPFDYDSVSARARRPQRQPVQRLRWIAATAAAALLAGLTLPIGSYAQSFLNIFQPEQFVAVPITQGELATLPSMSGLGSASRSGPPTIGSVSSTSQASGIVGFAAEQPGWLPAAMQQMQPTMAVVQEGTLTYTFKSPSLPAALQGSVLTMQVPPAFLMVYGPSLQSLTNGTATTPPSLTVAEMRAPVLQSSGATVQEIENTLLSQPGVSPTLRSEIEALGNSATTLPIPVPSGSGTSSQQVMVQGAQGLLLQRQGHAVLIWRKGSEIFAIYGPQSAKTLVAIANRLQA